jgi:hypothetical protein
MDDHKLVVPEESVEQELISNDYFQKSITINSDTKVFSGDEKLAPP